MSSSRSRQGSESQYLAYWGNLLHGNLGVSFNYFPSPVGAVIGQALPWTVVLVGLSTVIAWTVGTLVGIVAGWKRGGPWDFPTTPQPDTPHPPERRVREHPAEVAPVRPAARRAGKPATTQGAPPK